MRALVIGASGQVGAALLRVLRARGHEAVGTWAHEAFPGLVPLDFTDPAATERLVGETRPDWVLCPAALSHVDYCEEHPDEAFAANLHGPLAAAKAAARAGAGFVYYSSDYVFDGVDGPYAEDARPRPLGVYGQSKWEGEQAVLGALERALVVRTSVVYGPERQEKNSAYQLIRACRSGKGFRPAVDQRASPSYNPDVAAATVECCERGAARHLAPGRRRRAGPHGLRAPGLPRLRPGRLQSDAGDHGPARAEGGAPAQRRPADRQGTGRAPHPAARRRGGAPRDARGARGGAGPAPERPLTSPETYGTVTTWLSSRDGDRSSIG